MIQHLLFLREQIAHFDVDLTVTDIDLDFSHMRDHVRRIMTGEGGREGLTNHLTDWLAGWLADQPPHWLAGGWLAEAQ